jgi:uncharacterized membrane protein
MPRRYPRTYRWPKPVPFNYRPIVAVVAIVIFSLAAIAFVFMLRAHQVPTALDQRSSKSRASAS